MMTPITRQIGLGSALEPILWGAAQYDRQRCYELGSAQRVVSLDQLMDTAKDYAHRACDMAPRAVRNMREAIWRGHYMDPLQGQAFGAALEQNLRGINESIGGPLALWEGRRPDFTDTWAAVGG